MDTKRIEYVLAQYNNGERRVIELREPLADANAAHEGCASEFLAADDCDSPLLDYDLSCDMTEAEMSQVRDHDTCTILRHELFEGTDSAS